MYSISQAPTGTKTAQPNKRQRPRLINRLLARPLRARDLKQGAEVPAGQLQNASRTQRGLKHAARVLCGNGPDQALSEQPGAADGHVGRRAGRGSGEAAVIAATLALCLLLATNAARASLPPPFVIDGATESAPITVYSDYLRDPGGTLSLAEVRQPGAAERFRPAAHEIQRLGFSDDIWWVRFALRNATAEPLKRRVLVATGPVSSLTLFAPMDGGYRSRAPLPLDHDRLLPHNKRVFALTLPPRKTRVFYLRIRADHGFHYRLEIKTNEAQLTDTMNKVAGFWLLAGLTTALALYHLGLFLVTRKPVLLAYGSFFGLVVLVADSHSGMLFNASDLARGRAAHIDASLVFAALATDIWLARLFLHTGAALPRADRWLRFATAVLALSTVVLWLAPALMTLWLAYALAALVTIGLLWLGIVAWQRGTPWAPLYVVARSPFTLVATVVILAVQGWYALQYNFPLFLLGAAFLEALLLGFGIHHAGEKALRQRIEADQRNQLDEAIDNVRQDMLARVSHEVRTPMSGIMGMAEILEETPLTPNQHEYVRAIQSAGTELLRVVGDVFTFSGGAGEPSEPREEVFELTSCVMEALELFRERGEHRDIELVPHIHFHVPAQVRGDPVRLRQVLINLLACAARHGHPGELVIDITRDPTGRAGCLRFELSGSALRDTDTAWQGLNDSRAVADTRDSTALGLSIARQLVDSMGGYLQQRQDRELRPLCRFSLPLPDASESPWVSHRDSLNGYNLLIVDDSPTVTRVIRQQALSWGMRVTACHDPREALATLRTHAHIQDPFDLALLDQQMPGMDGVELARRIQEDMAGAGLALVMLSGVHATPSPTAAREAGLFEVLAKPVSGARLYRSILGALGLDQRPNETTGEGKATAVRKLRILVAEDDRLNQQVLEGMLSRLGMSVQLVNNGHAAVAAFDEQDFDLILMDCEMPEMDGFEAARAIRAREAESAREPVPIVALTAHILSEYRERSQAADMDAHVPKPVELAVLREVIHRFAATDAAERPDSFRARGESPG